MKQLAVWATLVHACVFAGHVAPAGNDSVDKERLYVQTDCEKQ